MKFSSRLAADEPDINLTSLIDVIFTLIIFFVVTTNFKERSAMKLQLPTSQAASTIEQAPPLTVMIDAQGRFFIDDTEVLKSDVASVKQAIIDAVAQDRSMPVILRADGRTPHQAVITAMDALGQLGFARLSIATTPEKKS
jgi:biopolymer transport protein ExbD